MKLQARMTLKNPREIMKASKLREIKIIIAKLQENKMKQGKKVKRNMKVLELTSKIRAILAPQIKKKLKKLKKSMKVLKLKEK